MPQLSLLVKTFMIHNTSELNFPKIEEFLALFRLTRAEAKLGSIKMAETLESNVRAAYFKRSEVMLVVEPNANHNSESWARRLPAAITFLYGDSRAVQ
jgi:hypothetical protein